MFKIKKLDFLISIYICAIALSELMGGKIFHLFNIGGFSLNASVAIFLIPLIYSINDVIIEVYGKERAQSIVRSGLCTVAFIVLFSLLAIHLPAANRFVLNEKSYEEVFNVSLRIAISSLTAFTIGEFADIFIFSKIRQSLGEKKLWFRTNVANVLSAFLDTTIFMILAFYALDKSFTSNMIFLFGIILPYWLLKCFMSIIETPFVYFGVKWLNNGGTK